MRGAQSSGTAASEDLPESPLLPENLDYAAFWCEENIAHFFLRRPFATGGAWALLVSNPKKSVAMARQRAGRASPTGLVYWDYHVVALAVDELDSPARIYDFDTELGFPVEAATWVDGSFPPSLPESMRPLFRLIESSQYVSLLSSDRSHMRRADGSWSAPPPPWPPFGAGRPNNLFSLIDMERESPGSLMDRASLLELCLSGCRSRS